MANIEIKVPNIGDFDAVTVIELLVKPGDTVAADQSLVTVESDKASMEIPSSHAGVVQALQVKLGDQIAEGSVLVTLQTDGAAASTAPEKEAASARCAGAGRFLPCKKFSEVPPLFIRATRAHGDEWPMTSLRFNDQWQRLVCHAGASRRHSSFVIRHFKSATCRACATSLLSMRSNWACSAGLRQATISALRRWMTFISRW